jgi:predicted ATPase
MNCHVDLKNLFLLEDDERQDTTAKSEPGLATSDEEFAKDRCISRLMEMQTKKYQLEPSYYEEHNPRTPQK